MTLDSHLLFAFLAVFARCTAMLLSSPLFGSVVPPNIRILFCMVLSASLVPVLKPYVGAVPGDLISLGLAIGREAVIGLLIGGALQVLLAAAQMAGLFLDLQIGLGSAQMFNPVMGMAATPIGQFKFMLGLVLLLLLNGHHLMFQAFVDSYRLGGPTLAGLDVMLPNVVGLIGQACLIALQIAAPVAAVCVVVDLAAGLVNKAVPQSQPFLLSLPAKLMLGIFVLALALPAMVVAMQGGLDSTFDALGRILSAN